MYALDAETGKLLWTADHPASGYKSAEDVLVVDGLVWITENTFGNQSGVCIGLDPKTGKVVKQFVPDVDTHWFHHRCYRAKATENYLIFSRTGIEFVDPKSEHWECHHWVRGACLYGVMPGNGMVYNPPHPCACYLEAKMFGFNALAPTSPTRRITHKELKNPRLEKGPAYDRREDLQSEISNLTSEISNFKSQISDFKFQISDFKSQSANLKAQRADWPTYRSTPSRSGFTSSAVPPAVEPKWQTNLGGRLTPPVVAANTALVASIDTHTIHALNATTGEPRWTHTVGGRVDSPPTVYQGRVLFGSADGYLYCLSVADGQLVWRFRAAPADRRHCVFGQLESCWPLHGSALIRDDQIWCIAGRSLFLDGGLRLLRIDPINGTLIDEKVIDDRDPDSENNLQVRLKGLNMPVALNDILSFDGKYVYMRSQRFDENGDREEIEMPNLDVSQQRGEDAHLFSPTGFLDNVLWHRSYWVFGRVWKSGAGGYYRAGRVAPAGRPMVFNDSTVFSYGRLPQYYRWTTPLQYQLYATAKQPDVIHKSPESSAVKSRKKSAAKPPTGNKRRRSGLGSTPGQRIAYDWTRECPIIARGMVLADKTLFLVGPPDVIDENETLSTFVLPETQDRLARQTAAIEGAEGSILWAVSTTDGDKLAELKLDMVPVFDGLAAAYGKLFMTTKDGRVLCLAGAK
jgi:outer membrane protein assembly factor BamB